MEAICNFARPPESSRKMHDRVHSTHRARDQLRFGQIAGDHLEPASRRDRARSSSQDSNCVTLLEKRSDEVATDEAGAARDEYHPPD
jgi:hypothetical protein